MMTRDDNERAAEDAARARPRPRRAWRPEGRGRRGAGRSPTCRPPTTRDWFRGRLPEAWFSDVDVTVDREEITVSRHARPSDVPTGPRRRAASAASASETKAERIEIALEAQARYERKVSWGVRLGDTEALFTHVAAPVMTRLRQPERQVLDTLVDAGVARSRSDALAWSVRLVGQHADEWLGQLRDAMAEVDKLRGEGPSL